MQKAPAKAITCPNCGSRSVRNFCSQCGQSNHLHRETFWSLITHFFGHYFHYESKFWQTLKALWFSPGKLTLAYWKNQRMRYVAPVSLYIFISTVFFLVTYVSPVKFHDSLEINFNIEVLKGKSQKEITNGYNRLHNQESKSIQEFVQYKAYKFGHQHPNYSEYLQARLVQSFVKISFFIIPITGFVLMLLFIRRKSVLFVDHAVFSLHFQSFWFSVFVLFYLYPFSSTQDLFFYLLVIAAFIYLVAAIKNVYKTGSLQTAAAAITIAFAYLLFPLIMGSAYIILLVLLS